MNIMSHLHYTLIVIALAIIHLAAQPDSGTIVHVGQATYYNATGAGNCGFDATPNDLAVCAMNNKEYDTASVCGASIHIIGPKGEVTVRIVDRCPGCPAGNVDLSKEAFAKIADTIQGRVTITWYYVETLVAGPIQYRFVTGSNQWWVGIQVLNHRNPVTKLEAFKNGVWVALPRMEWNVFVDSTGLGAGPFSFRVTDLYGQQLIDANIKLVPDSIQNGAANFTSHTAVAFGVPAVHPGIKMQHHASVAVVTGGTRRWQGMQGQPYAVYDLAGRFLGTLDNEKFAAGNSGAAGNGIVIVKPTF